MSNQPQRYFSAIVGESLCVSIKDIYQYRDALIDFWEKMSDELENDK